MKSVYIHIPFCSNICSYCDFTKIYYNKKYINNYLDNLEKEINSRYKGEPISTLFIGGGTPSSMDLEELERLFQILTIFKTKDLEYSIECNPENLTLEKIKLFKIYGINRVSLGVQSFDKNILNILNRKHTNEHVYKIIKLLKDNLITNINIDLIYGVNTNKNILVKDLNTFLSLDIPHISCYSLILENNTILHNKKHMNINEDIDYEMYKYIENTLERNNYIHYEISNYCKKGYECKHNLTYWYNLEYYGFGLSSVSYIDNTRITNTKNLTKYLNGNYIDKLEYEDIETRKYTDIMLGLRLLNGINIDIFNSKYKANLIKDYCIDNLIKDKKLILENNYLRLNKEYIYLENEILLKFIKEDI